MPKDKSKPKGAITPYALFVRHERDEIKKKNPTKNVDFTTFSKECSVKWNAMDESAKQKFVDLAEKDKIRYRKEMANYTPAAGSDKKGAKSKKKEKDPNAPKRAMPAFFLFSNDERTKVKADHLDWSVADIAKELGKRWEVCKNRAKYDQLAATEKARYEKEMQKYKAGKK